jgi:hypothetical protein
LGLRITERGRADGEGQDESKVGSPHEGDVHVGNNDAAHRLDTFSFFCFLFFAFVVSFFVYCRVFKILKFGNGCVVENSKAKNPEFASHTV